MSRREETESEESISKEFSHFSSCSYSRASQSLLFPPAPSDSLIL